MFPTLTDYQFYCVKTAPKWTEHLDRVTHTVHDIDTVINSHCTPVYIKGKSVQSMEWREHKKKSEQARISSNLLNLCKMARRKGELTSILKKVYVCPHGCDSKKQQAMAKKWLNKMGIGLDTV